MTAWEATADQLCAAGWGDTPRSAIPADWATRRPPESNQRWKGKRKPRLADAHKTWRQRRALYLLDNAAGRVIDASGD